MKYTTMLPVDLHLFEASAAATGGTGDGAAAPANGINQGDTQASSVNTQPGKNDLKNIKYGKQPEAEGDNAEADGDNASDHMVEPSAAEGENGQGDNTPRTLEELNRSFDELINGDYKDVYTQRTQALINRRFNSVRALEAENAELREIADMLGVKYGISGEKDFSKLKAAVEGDEGTWQRAAFADDMTVDAKKRQFAMERELNSLRAAHENDIIAQRNRETAQRWYDEATALRTKFPQFDLKTELSDPQFVAAIQAGVPMEIVYKGKYYDQNLENVASGAAKAAEKRVTDSIRAKGARPLENGIVGQSATFTTKSDPSNLTLGDFNEIARRIARGEKITF